MSAADRPCAHDKSVEPLEMTLLESRLGYRVIAHSSQSDHPGQVQNLDAKGHVDSVRPASNVEVQLYGILLYGTVVNPA